MSVDELRVLVPQIDWRRYLSIVLARPIQFSEPVVVFALQYIQDLVVLLSKAQPRCILDFFTRFCNFGFLLPTFCLFNAKICKALRAIHYFRRTVANYLLWRFVRHRVNNLDDRFQEVKQRFYYILFGREQAPSRWKNCVTQVNSNMDMVVGSMFVKKYFDENSKNDVSVLTFLRFTLRD